MIRFLSLFVVFGMISIANAAPFLVCPITDGRIQSYSVSEAPMGETIFVPAAIQWDLSLLPQGLTRLEVWAVKPFGEENCVLFFGLEALSGQPEEK
jgi:hypothetical protein